MNWLTCLFKGHEYEFIHTRCTYLEELGTQIPYKTHKIYVCKKCLKSKAVRV